MSNDIKAINADIAAIGHNLNDHVICRTNENIRWVLYDIIWPHDNSIIGRINGAIMRSVNNKQDKS